MAGAIGVAAALRARLVQLKCPYCGHVKQADPKPVSHRVCPRCRKHFVAPGDGPAARTVRKR